jgi:hypothetical protein
MLMLLVWFIILLVIFSILWLIVRQIPIPAPYAWVPGVILGLIFLVIVICLLTGNLGGLGTGHSLLR